MLSDTPDLHRIMQVNELSGVGGEKREVGALENHRLWKSSRTALSSACARAF
jgi:hypothetical protein